VKGYWHNCGLKVKWIDGGIQNAMGEVVEVQRTSMTVIQRTHDMIVGQKNGEATIHLERARIKRSLK